MCRPVSVIRAKVHVDFEKPEKMLDFIDTEGAILER